jgi:hypothetical protein
MRRNLATVAFCGILGTALPASADPVRITNGILVGSDSSVTDFAMVHPGFRLVGIVGSDAFGEPHWRCDPLPCAVGSPLSLSSRYSGLDEVDGTFDGLHYPNVLTSFDFQSSTITIPDLPLGITTIISRPFTFTGTITGFTNGVPGTSHELVGSGTVSIWLSRWDSELGGNGMNVTRTQYEFESGATPVPEPASMLLVGSGLAGLVAARRRRR